ncbi:hypothetical protein LOAG_14671, partial [Loa loa]
MWSHLFSNNHSFDCVFHFSTTVKVNYGNICFIYIFGKFIDIDILCEVEINSYGICFVASVEVLLIEEDDQCHHISANDLEEYLAHSLTSTFTWYLYDSTIKLQFQSNTIQFAFFFQDKNRTGCLLPYL